MEHIFLKLGGQQNVGIVIVSFGIINSEGENKMKEIGKAIATVGMWAAIAAVAFTPAAPAILLLGGMGFLATFAIWAA